ncbi:MAG: amidohydrolase family protein [Pseudomonadota bacterium]
MDGTSPKTNTYALTDTRIVDVRAGEILRGKAVVIEDGRITQLAEEASLAANVPQVPLGQRYLCPGLIDCHAHCYIGAFGDRNSVLPSELTARAGRHLEGMLQRGFTTMRDAGGADQGHRAAVEKGIWAGPRLFVSGRILSQTAGHGDHRSRADTRPIGANDGGISVIADGVDEVRKAVRENVRLGVDQIKIMAGGGVSSPGDKLIHPQYSEEELDAIVGEAARSGRYVMAHVYADDGIRRAVTSGVRSIEHGNFLQAETAKIMVDHDAHICPTLITYEADAKYGMGYGWSAETHEKNAEVLRSGLVSLEVAMEAGVNVGYGTDLCWSPKAYQGDGLLIHEKVCGAAEALRHATINNARILRMEGEIGEIAEDAHADLVVIDANPLAGLACFAQTDNRVVAVIQAGRAVRDELELLPRP